MWQRNTASSLPQPVASDMGEGPTVNGPETTGSESAGSGARSTAGWPGLTLGSETNPQAFGRYGVVEKLGEGGAGQVFACHDPLLDRQVALKVLHAGLEPSLRELNLERFRVELKVFGRVTHPNVVAVYDACLEGERPYLVMELCSGPTVSDWLTRNGPCSMGQAAFLAHQLALALDHIHSIGIVHRDVKPANLLFHHQSLKLTDFGVARASFLTTRPDEGMVGTPGYMPREQLMGEPTGPRADLFSLAATLFELLTGQVPFGGDPSSLLYERQFDEVPAVTSIAPDLTPDFDEFFERALARDPDKRFASGAELSDALSRLVPEDELEAFGVQVGARAQAVAAPLTFSYGKLARRSGRYLPLKPRREPPPPKVADSQKSSGAVPVPWMNVPASKAADSFELISFDTRPEGVQTLNALKARDTQRNLPSPVELPFAPHEPEPVLSPRASGSHPVVPRPSSTGATSPGGAGTSPGVSDSISRGLKPVSMASPAASGPSDSARTSAVSSPMMSTAAGLPPGGSLPAQSAAGGASSGVVAPPVSVPAMSSPPGAALSGETSALNAVSAPSGRGLTGMARLRMPLVVGILLVVAFLVGAKFGELRALKQASDPSAHTDASNRTPQH